MTIQTGAIVETLQVHGVTVRWASYSISTPGVLKVRINEVLVNTILFSVLRGRAFVFQHSRWARGTEVSLARCVEIPQSCAAGVDQMRETASTIKTEVLEELSATSTRFDQIASDFVGCTSSVASLFTSQVSSYRSSFKAKVESHTLCRKQQQAEQDVSMMCTKFWTAMRVNRTLLRGRPSLTESAADLVSLCKPSAKEPLGMWWEDMAEIFCKRHTLWKKDREACKQAEVVIPVQQSKCKIAASVLNERKQQCGRELDRAESFSC